MNTELLSKCVILFAAFLVASFPKVCVGQDPLETSDFERLRKVITGDDATAQQIESAVQENTGRRVEWTGWVELIRDDASVVVDMDKPDVFWSMQDVELLDLPSYVAGELERDDEITFSGRVAELFNGAGNSLQVRIENAALEGEFAVDEQTAKKQLEQERKALIDWWRKYSSTLEGIADEEEVTALAKIGLKPARGKQVTQRDISRLKEVIRETENLRNEMERLDAPDLSRVDAQSDLEEAIEDFEYAVTSWNLAVESLIEFLRSSSQRRPTDFVAQAEESSKSLGYGRSSMEKVAESYNISGDIMP
jgi:hypothetical protein